MDMGNFYPTIIGLVLLFLIVGVGVLLFDKLGVTTSTIIENQSIANQSFMAGRDAIGSINTSWASLIITMIILAVIIGLVIRGFGSNRS